MSDRSKPIYLDDAIYAETDGNIIWLGFYEYDHRIALTRISCRNLKEFIDKTFPEGAANQKRLTNHEE